MCRLMLGSWNLLQTEIIQRYTLRDTEKVVQLLLHSSTRNVQQKRIHQHSSKMISWKTSVGSQKSEVNVVELLQTFHLIVYDIETPASRSCCTALLTCFDLSKVGCILCYLCTCMVVSRACVAMMIDIIVLMEYYRAYFDYGSVVHCTFAVHKAGLSAIFYV